MAFVLLGCCLVGVLIHLNLQLLATRLRNVAAVLGLRSLQSQARGRVEGVRVHIAPKWSKGERWKTVVIDAAYVVLCGVLPAATALRMFSDSSVVLIWLLPAAALLASWVAPPWTIVLEPQGRLTMRLRTSSIADRLGTGLTATALGDADFDRDIVANGPVLELFATLDATTRREVRLLLECGGRVEAGTIALDIAGNTEPAVVEERVRWLVGIAKRLGSAEIDSTLKEPIVGEHAALAVVSSDSDENRRRIRAEILQGWQGRPLVDAISEGGALAVFALDVLAECGRIAHVQPIRERARGDVIEAMAGRAVAEIRSREQGGGSGRISLAVGETGQLALATADELLGTMKRPNP